MIRKDELTGLSGDRRIYRFHLGWSAAGRANHFNLTSPTSHQPYGFGGAVIRDSSARDANPPLPKRDRASQTTTESES